MRWITLAALIFSAAAACAAQIVPIPEADYAAALAKALDAASSHERRVSTDETFYTGTQTTGTRRIVSEFVGKDAKKIDVVEDFQGKRTRSDAVTLSGQFFCKVDEKAWKRADKQCAAEGKMMAIPDGAYEYFVDPDANVPGRKTYTRRAKYEDSGVPERDAARLKFIEIKFVTDDSGLILEYTETRRGGIDPNGWSSTQVTRYEYEPAGLKINDPTKGN